jgi:hypothetical protein
MGFLKSTQWKPYWLWGVDEIFILTCDIYCPIVVQFVTRRDVDVMPLGLYEVRENQPRKGRNFH